MSKKNENENEKRKQTRSLHIDRELWQFKIGKDMVNIWSPKGRRHNVFVWDLVGMSQTEWRSNSPRPKIDAKAVRTYIFAFLRVSVCHGQKKRVPEKKAGKPALKPRPLTRDQALAKLKDAWIQFSTILGAPEEDDCDEAKAYRDLETAIEKAVAYGPT